VFVFRSVALMPMSMNGAESQQGIGVDRCTDDLAQRQRFWRLTVEPWNDPWIVTFTVKSDNTVCHRPLR
jgi:hypothetical protein